MDGVSRADILARWIITLLALHGDIEDFLVKGNGSSPGTGGVANTCLGKRTGHFAGFTSGTFTWIK